MTYFGVTVIGNFRRPRIKDERHLRVIRRLPCVVSGQQPCECCHIRFADRRFNKRETGLGERPDDMWVLPMIRDCHIDQHSGNEQEFWKSKDIDATALAKVLYGVWQNPGVRCASDAEAVMRFIVGGLPR